MVLLAGHDASFQSSLRCEGASQYPPSLVQLGLGVAARTVEHRGNFAVIETVNVVKEEDAAITGRHTGDSPIDSQTVNDAGLCQVASAETLSGAFFGNAFHQVIEGNNSQHALAQVH